MRILLIEDEEKLAQSLKKALETERFAVDICFDGQEGYEMATGEEYDLIILDLGLPNMDGITIAKKLRDEKTTTPILMLTARDTINNKIEGLNSGADDYIVKPFDFDELVARIRALIRRTKTKGDLIYTIDTLTLDPVAHVVKRVEKEIALSAKEYSLLEFLMSRQESIVSRTDIIDHVWDIDMDPFSNVVDVYIGYLRNKIDKQFPHEKPMIKTIKGMGYKVG